MQRRCYAVVLAAALVDPSVAADGSQPHYHAGKLTPYQIGPPSVLLSSNDEARLQTGKSVVQCLVGDDGQTRRMVMVCDIPAPSNIVLGRIMDFNHYDRMVSGVDSCVTYASNEAGGVQTVKSEYEISVLHMKFKYFVEHMFNPSEQCMVFRLDYSRRSDLDDTVGYWYVEKQGNGNRPSSRVYYSCECKLRGWVPGPVYSMMTKEAIKKATVWVSDESIKEWRRCSSQQGLTRFVSNVRQQLDSLKLPEFEGIKLPARWADGRKEAAVKFVSARRALQSRRFGATRVEEESM